MAARSNFCTCFGWVRVFCHSRAAGRWVDLRRELLLWIRNLGWPRPLLSGSRAPRTPMETPRDPCCRALQTAYGPGAIIRWHRLEVLTIHDYFSATFHGVVI